MKETPIIEIRNLTYRYPVAEGMNQLADVNLKIARGSFVLLTGESGCGKSTLLSCINGLATEFFGGTYEGDILLSGQSIKDEDSASIGEKVGTVFQNPRSQFFTTDTEDEVAFGLENMNLPREQIEERSRQVFSDLNIEHLHNRSIFELSSGERQLIAIASVCAMGPEVILLDEPSANLDPDSISLLKAALVKLKEAGRTIIIVEHRYEYLAALIDEVVYMENGQIVEIPEKHTLSVEGLSFSYGRGKPVLTDFSISADSGEIIGIRGRCGCGKTTFAGILAGLMKPSSGKILWDGIALSEKQRLEKTYFVLQDSDYQLFAESVRAELHVGNRKRRPVLDEDILSQFGIAEKIDAHPMALSRGQKQRLTIAAGLVCEADIYIFDEPTSGLDRKHMRVVADMIQTIASMGKIIILISHDYELLRKCSNRVICMEEAKSSEEAV